jgi:hypothetical protein
VARFHRVLDVARDAAPGAGESDRRRLARAFASLKNTFTLYDVKDGFIDGLAEGGPDGGERARLAEFEAQAAEFGAAAKAGKAANAAAVDSVRAMVDGVCDAHAAYEAERDAALTALDEVEAAEGGGAASSPGAGSPSFPGVPPHVVAALGEEADAARQLEAAAAAADAEAAALAAAAAADRAEAAALDAEADRLARASGDGGDAAAAPATADERLARAGAWCAEAASLLAALSGVAVAGVADDGALTLDLTPSSDMCDGGGERESGRPPAAAAARLRVEFAAPSASGRPALVASLTLDPPSVPVADIAPAVAGAPSPLAAAVAEVVARAAARLRRAELLEEAAAAYALTPPPRARDGDLVAVLPGGGEATVAVPAAWPRPGARLAVTKLTAPRPGADVGPALRALAARRALGDGSICALLAAATGAVDGLA